MLLLATIPIFAAGLGHFLPGERPHPLSYLAIMVTIIGSALIVWADVRWEPENITGDLFAVAAAIISAGYMVARRYLTPTDRKEFFPYILTVYASSTVVLLALVVITGETGRLFDHTPTIWFWFAVLAVVGTVTGHSLLNKALDYFKAHVAGIWVLTEPIMAALSAWLVLGEGIQPHILWGLGPIYLGVYWVLRLERNRK